MAHQEGVASPGLDCACFVVIHALPIVFVDENKRKALLARVSEIDKVRKFVLQKVEKYAPVNGFDITVGLGMELASLVFPRYAALPKYRNFEGKHAGMKYSGGDILVHVKTPKVDTCFEAARAIVQHFAEFTRDFEDTFGLSLIHI